MKPQICIILGFMILTLVGCTNQPLALGGEASATSAATSTHVPAGFSLTSTVDGTEEQASLIYYASGRGLHRLTDLRQESDTIIHTGDNQVEYRFSHDRKLVAFWEDSTGLWLSSLKQWDPQHIIVDDRRLSYGLMWTPDDTRIVAKVSRGKWQNATEIPEGTETLAYNTLTKTTEKWSWGVCEQIARNLGTMRPALICHPDPWMLEPTPATIALEWGGQYHPFKQQEYEVLLERLSVTSTWAWLDMGQWLVYSARNPEFDIVTNPDVPLHQIYSVRTSADAIPLVTTNALDNDLFAISENQKLIAYWISYNGSCLEITDLETGNVVWGAKNNFCVPFPEDLVWYPDNQHIAVLGYGENHVENSIWTLDIVMNDVTQVVLPDYASVFTVVKAGDS